MNSDTHLSGLANHLVKDGLLEYQTAMEVLQKSKQANISFVSYLVKNRIINSDKITQNCSKNFGISVFDLKNFSDDWLSHLQPEFIQRYRIIPLYKEKNTLHIGINDPTDRNIVDTVTFHTGLSITPFIVCENQITEFLKKYFSKSKKITIPKELFIDESYNIIKENSVHYDEPLIRFVDEIILHAIQQTASDIHFEPYETKCRIRYRQDGLLYEISDIPLQLSSRLLTRLKVMSKLDIAERRFPQDGRMQRHGIDIRISTCPTLFGEKIVLRLLNSSNKILAIDELGLTSAQEKIFIEKISKPQGLILVTGPTGSGKTFTLYSALNYLNSSEKNILTIEDPIEIQLNGINQVNINSKIGLEFSNTLKTFLRQDPDIIMIGEIRDFETGEIAMQAAQTGHLVLSTLHTNNALDAFARLQSMKISLYNIVSSISLIIAQRLVRKLCENCKIPDDTNDIPAYSAVGCEHCFNGYKDRIGVYEFLSMTDTLSQQLLAENNFHSIQKHAEREGFVSLQKNCMGKVKQGLTSFSEFKRVCAV